MEEIAATLAEGLEEVIAREGEVSGGDGGVDDAKEGDGDGEGEEEEVCGALGGGDIFADDGGVEAEISDEKNGGGEGEEECKDLVEGDAAERDGPDDEGELEREDGEDLDEPASEETDEDSKGADAGEFEKPEGALFFFLGDQSDAELGSDEEDDIEHKVAPSVEEPESRGGDKATDVGGFGGGDELEELDENESEDEEVVTPVAEVPVEPLSEKGKRPAKGGGIKIDN